MKKHIVCLGDSNTHGYCADPSDCADGALQRFNEDERWTRRLQAALGEDYLVLEEGLSGRTTVFRDPLYEGLAAIDYIHPCLKSHEPVALLIIMLGTNDTKERFSANAHCIALGMEDHGRGLRREVPPPPAPAGELRQADALSLPQRGGVRIQPGGLYAPDQKGPRTIGGSAGGGRARIDTGLRILR